MIKKKIDELSTQQFHFKIKEKRNIKKEILKKKKKEKNFICFLIKK